MKLVKYYKEPDNKYNIVSVSAFRLRKGYRPSMVYFEGLKKWFIMNDYYVTEKSPDFGKKLKLFHLEPRTAVRS